MARSPITKLMDEFHNLSKEEQALFLDLVDPQPETQTTKTKRKRTGKSKRASAMADTLKNNLEQSRAAAATAGGSDGTDDIS